MAAQYAPETFYEHTNDVKVVITIKDVVTWPEVFIYPEIVLALTIFVMAALIGHEEERGDMFGEGDETRIYYPTELGQKNPSMYIVFTLAEMGYFFIILIILLALFLSDRPQAMQLFFITVGIFIFAFVGVCRLIGTSEYEKIGIPDDPEEEIISPNCMADIDPELERTRNFRTYVQVSNALGSVEIILALVFFWDVVTRVVRREWKGLRSNLSGLEKMPSLLTIPMLLMIWILFFVFRTGHAGGPVFPLISTSGRWPNNSFVEHFNSSSLLVATVDQEPSRKLYCTMVIVTFTLAYTVMFFSLLLNDVVDMTRTIISFGGGCSFIVAGYFYIDASNLVFDIIDDPTLSRDIASVVLGGICIAFGFIFFMFSAIFFLALKGREGEDKLRKLEMADMHKERQQLTDGEKIVNDKPVEGENELRKLELADMKNESEQLTDREKVVNDQPVEGENELAKLEMVDRNREGERHMDREDDATDQPVFKINFNAK